MIFQSTLARAMCALVSRACLKMALRREPDFIIGGRADPYLNRWWVIPRNRFLNVYLHEFVRDDDDRALHDHPWVSVSLSLGCRRGREVDRAPHMIEVYRDAAGCERRRYVGFGAIVFRRANFAHRMIVPTPGSMTLFITGPRVREWGFLCPKGWKHWKDFTAAGDSARVGKGCDS